MFISNIFPSDLDVYDTMSMQVHVHFKASSPVIHMVYDCTFVQVHVHFKHLPGDQDDSLFHSHGVSDPG